MPHTTRPTICSRRFAVVTALCIALLAGMATSAPRADARTSDRLAVPRG